MIDKVFLINLERRPNKLKNMLNRIKLIPYLDNKLEVFNAIDGKKLNKKNLELCNYKINDWLNPQTGNSITFGEIGCALSHYTIWNKINKEKYRNTLILEDDVIFSENFEEKLQNLFNQINKNKIKYDLFYLNRKSFQKDIEKLSENIFIPNFSYWTCAYIITNDGVNKLINSNYKCNIIPIDEFLPLCYLNDINELNKYNYNINNFKAIVCNPHIINCEPNAFQKSDTEISKNYNIKKNWVNAYDYSLQIVTVASEETDGYKRFIKSLNKYNLPFKVLGMNEKWEGNDMSKGSGGGQKVNLLKKYLQNLKISESNKKKYLILFSDSYDVICNANYKEIIAKYLEFKSDIVFTAECYCWPDKSLAKDYIKTNTVFKYLNSGGFIGTIESINHITKNNINNYDDDQLYYTHTFLKINKINLNNIIIKLDYNCEIFQAINGVFNDLDIDFNKSRLINNITKSNPCFIHGNGDINSKLFLNQLCNYLPLNWRPIYLYQDLGINNSLFDNILYEDYPYINIIYFFNEFNISSFNNIVNLKYPKNKIKLTVLIFNNLEDKLKNINEYIKNIKYYDNIEYFNVNNNNILIKILKNIFKKSFDYVFFSTSDHIIENNKILQLLMQKNKDIISPMLTSKKSNFSNFWGKITENGYYQRSWDYFDFYKYKKLGCWNIPYIYGTILIHKNKFSSIDSILSDEIINLNEDFDMFFCKILRNKCIFLYVTNLEKYGYIIKE